MHQRTSDVSDIRKFMMKNRLQVDEFLPLTGFLIILVNPYLENPLKQAGARPLF